MIEDKRLIWTCSPRQPWLAVNRSLYLQPPVALACRGRGTGLFLSSKQLGRNTYVSCEPKRTGKKQRDAHSTSKLGVSRCQALSTLTEGETQTSMHAKTYGASTSFIYAQGLRLALYKGLHALPARLVQKGGFPGSPATAPYG